MPELGSLGSVRGALGNGRPCDGGRQAVQLYGALPEREGAFLSSYARTLFAARPTRGHRKCAR